LNGIHSIVDSYQFIKFCQYCAYHETVPLEIHGVSLPLSSPLSPCGSVTAATSGDITSSPPLLVFFGVTLTCKLEIRKSPGNSLPRDGGKNSKTISLLLCL
jgi:hypothetical protein